MRGWCARGGGWVEVNVFFLNRIFYALHKIRLSDDDLRGSREAARVAKTIDQCSNVLQYLTDLRVL